MSLRFHEIAEANHRILNPFSADQLMLLGEICRVSPETRQLDLCCGKGEMLCRWAERHGSSGVGVDISKVFIPAARARAAQLRVTERVSFVEADASTYPVEAGGFDIVSCIGATWIGDGLLGTIALMRGGLRGRDSLLLVGEPFWLEPPPEEAYELLAGGREVFTTLPGTLDRFESAGLELVEMVLADHAGWDRYEAMQWMATADWLRANADSPEATEIRDLNRRYRRQYLTYGRRYFGWGVFVLRQAGL
jgi:SAM-dependent methyltransferase